MPFPLLCLTNDVAFNVEFRDCKQSFSYHKRNLYSTNMFYYKRLQYNVFNNNVIISLFPYLPISLLPLLSKIIERIIHNQTQEFLDKNNILYKYQSGFRKHHSTDTCPSYLNDKVKIGFEEGLLTGMVLIDAIKKGCSTQSIINLASDLLEILCSHREK